MNTAATRSKRLGIATSERDVMIEDPGRRRRRRLALTGGAAALVLVSTLGWMILGRPPAVARREVVLATAAQGPFAASVTASGSLAPANLTVISLEQAALVRALQVQVGDRVSTGQVLATLENQELQLQVLDARKTLGRAIATASRDTAEWQAKVLEAESELATLKAEAAEASRTALAYETLADKGFMSPVRSKAAREAASALSAKIAVEQRRIKLLQQLTGGQAAAGGGEISQERAALTVLERQYERLSVRAPVAGVVSDILVSVGVSGRAGDPLLRISSADELRAQIQVPASRSQRLKIGQPAEVRLGSNVHKANVVRIDPSVRDGYVNVDLRILSPLGPDARIGQYVQGSIETSRRPSALVVQKPKQTEENAAADVYVLSKHGRTLEKRRVQFGASSGDRIEVLQGLKAGDMIAVSDVPVDAKEVRLIK